MQPQKKCQQNDAKDIVIFYVFLRWNFFLQVPGGAKASPVRGQVVLKGQNTPPVSAPREGRNDNNFLNDYFLLILTI